MGGWGQGGQQEETPSSPTLSTKSALVRVPQRTHVDTDIRGLLQELAQAVTEAERSPTVGCLQAGDPGEAEDRRQTYQLRERENSPFPFLFHWARVIR